MLLPAAHAESVAQLLKTYTGCVYTEKLRSHIMTISGDYLEIGPFLLLQNDLVTELLRLYMFATLFACAIYYFFLQFIYSNLINTTLFAFKYIVDIAH